MRIVKISKSNGKHRTIYIPNAIEMIKLKQFVPELRNKVVKICNMDVVHAFLHDRSAVTCAKRHIGYQYTMSFDITNYFDNITPDHVKKYLTEKEIAECFVDGHPRQGLPTSPDISNLAGKVIDDSIIKWIKKNKIDAVYTRYADDITISYNDQNITKEICNKVKETVHRSGFKLNPEKTKYYPAKGGMRIVCGIAVGDDDIYPTRKTKRKLRAAQKHGNPGSINGLEEWCKLKEPGGSGKKDVYSINRDVGKIKNYFSNKCRRVSVKKLIQFQKSKLLDDQDLGENMYITNDLGYFIGMSDFVCRWSSCYKKNGIHYRAPVAYLSHPGVSLAVFLDDKKETKGVKRNKMRARVLLYVIANGKKAYGEIYGENEKSKKALRNKLEANGFICSSKVKGKVKGLFVITPRHTDVGQIKNSNLVF